MIDKLEAGKNYRLIDKEGWLSSHEVNKENYHLFFDDRNIVTISTVTKGVGFVNGRCTITEDEYKYFELVEDIDPLVKKCIEDNGYWKIGCHERYWHWNEQDGWNLKSGESVYYGSFKKGAISLGLLKEDQSIYFPFNREEVSTPTKRYWDGKEPLEVGMIVKTDVDNFETSILFVDESQILLKNQKGVLYVQHINRLLTCSPDSKEEFCKEVLTTVRGTHPDFAQDMTWDIKEVAAICWDKLKGGESE